MTIDYAKFVGFQGEDTDLSVLIDQRGAMRTANLFIESTPHVADTEKYPPLYTLRNRTTPEGIPSAYLIYMTSCDEFEAAMKLVGTLTHWRKLLKCKWFMDGGQGFEGLTQWREDMNMRDMSIAKRALIKSAGTGDTSSARKLFDISEPKKETRPVGRPTTKSEKLAVEAAERASEEEAEIERLHADRTGRV